MGQPSGKVVLKFIDETENLSLAERAEDAISQTSLI
mgnify:CR=1 FL=1